MRKSTGSTMVSTSPSIFTTLGTSGTSIDARRHGRIARLLTSQLRPYQFDHFRIVEFAAYHGFAQAFAGTIPFSESVGFIADYHRPDTLDYVTGITAHEFAHQGDNVMGCGEGGNRPQ